MVWTPSRIALAAITAGVVATGVGAGVLLQPGRDRPEPAAMGPDVSIAVVAPREPEPEPGSVMDVGELADGYIHRDYIRPALVSPQPRDAVGDDPSPGEEPPPFERTRVITSASALPPVMVERPEPPPRRRWPFGFDQPRPDYAAERRERRARMDEARRLEDEQRFEEARRRERFDDRRAYGPPPDDRGREPYEPRDGGPRERQWYASDGRPVPGPAARD
jgi:hypothetical protein